MCIVYMCIVYMCIVYMCIVCMCIVYMCIVYMCIVYMCIVCCEIYLLFPNVYLPRGSTTVHNFLLFSHFHLYRIVLLIKLFSIERDSTLIAQ